MALMSDLEENETLEVTVSIWKIMSSVFEAIVASYLALASSLPDIKGQRQIDLPPGVPLYNTVLPQNDKSYSSL
jgi:hypothetical protein